MGGGEAGALVVRFCNTCPKASKFWHRQTKAHESAPNGRLVTEQFANRDVLLIQGKIIIRTSPNNWNSVAQSLCFESHIPFSVI